MHNAHEFDALTFIMESGPVAILVALSLLVMSVASWYLILVKGLHMLRLKQEMRSFVQGFWISPAQKLAGAHHEYGPAARLVSQAVEAAAHHEKHVASIQDDVCNRDEFIARSLRRSLANESARLESGLTILASVGSVSPFVGLFGTVWGIYHALASISASGQATLDKVAGPVGEALIMTAIGLAVAIPAVLAYNALVRSNRVLTADLEDFAQDLHIYLCTGAAFTLKQAENKTATHASKAQVHLKEVKA